jgi:hypothetical protein
LGNRSAGYRFHVGWSAPLMTPEHAARILAVDIGASKDEIGRARRRMALTSHPDVGGSDHDMAQLNEAYRVLVGHADDDSAEVTPNDFRVRDVDRPSFVIDRLPVEAFEFLLLAARVLGDVADEEPPYLLDVLLEDPPMTWCRLEIVPDAGGSTVSILSDGQLTAGEMCELWVRTINEISLRGAF